MPVSLAPLAQSLFQLGESIELHGFMLKENPVASAVIPLLNLSNVLQAGGKYDDAVECDMLCGLALGNSRRFVQVRAALPMSRRASGPSNLRPIAPTEELTNKCSIEEARKR